VILLDTNVLVYAADKDSPRYEPCHDVVLRALARVVDGVLVPQVLLEFYATVTGTRARRPLAPATGWRLVEALMAGLPVLEVRLATLDMLGGMVRQRKLGGHRIFDLFLSAQMRTHGVREICTDNARDFRRLGVTARTPENVLQSLATDQR